MASSTAIQQYKTGDKFVHIDYGTVYEVLDINPGATNKKSKPKDTVYRMRPTPSEFSVVINGKRVGTVKGIFDTTHSQIQKMLTYERWKVADR